MNILTQSQQCNVEYDIILRFYLQFINFFHVKLERKWKVTQLLWFHTMSKYQNLQVLPKDISKSRLLVTLTGNHMTTIYNRQDTTDTQIQPFDAAPATNGTIWKLQTQNILQGLWKLTYSITWWFAYLQFLPFIPYLTSVCHDNSKDTNQAYHYFAWCYPY